jgi:dolichol-phosphate mannosyltransferase
MNEASEPEIHAPSSGAAPPILSIVVPTYNERDNISKLLARLDLVLNCINWEIIFVDDNSSDETWRLVRAFAARDARIRCLRRIGRRGLAGACIEGMLASSAPYVAVIDADLQHDETLLPRMLATLREDRADLVVGSRFVIGANVDSLPGHRLAVSRLASHIARRLFRMDVADPISGFFMMRRECFEPFAPTLSIHGFKILLDIVATARGALRIVELPYNFRERLHGESKLDMLIMLDFLGLILAKLTRDTVSVRFVLFSLIGAIGLLVHLAAMYVAIGAFGLSFTYAQIVAAIIAMINNFFLNNQLTFRDQRLAGVEIVRGLVVFIVICSIGVIANVGVAFSLYGLQPVWWLAGIAGAAMGVIWNYAMSSQFVWKIR